MNIVSIPLPSKKSGGRPMSIPDPAIGEVFGRLTVISEFQVYKGGRKALVRCECGVEKLQLKKTLTRGDAKSCGCLFKEKITTAVKHKLYPQS